nr:hypothetical protein [Tanacetum cinerariifolium]
MSRDVLTVGCTMWIPLLYRGEYSQRSERFMNYLEEQTDGGAMINSIKNGDQLLPRVTQVSIAGTSSTEQPPLKDKSMCNKTAKDLWDALARHMLESEYVINDLNKCGYSKDNCELNFKFLNNLQPEWKQYATMMRQNKNLLDINIDALYNILKQNQGDMNDAMKSKKKEVVITYDPLALVAEQTKITALLAKAFNQKKFYSKPTNNNLRTSSATSSANKKQEYVKSDDKKEEKKVDEKKRDMSKVKCYNCKKEGHFANDCKKAKIKDYEYYKTKMLLAKKDKDEQVLLAEDYAWMESSNSEASSSSSDDKIAEIVQICLWIIDSRCSKQMTSNRAPLTNFVEKFLGTVRFGKNDFTLIACYRDVGLRVAFQKSTGFVRNEDGVDLLTGDCSSNLYTISLNEVVSNSSACLLAKAYTSQSWLWHQSLSHLNFATINSLVKNNLVRGLLKTKFEKDHLCFVCEQGKIHRKHHKSKMAFASNKPLYLLHMNLCGLMRVESINGKCYLLNDYDDVGKLKAKRDIRVFVRYSKESAAFRIYNKRTRNIQKSMNANFDEISEMASKQFRLEPGLSNLNETGKSSNPTVSQIMKSSTMNVETFNVEIPLQEEEVFHESFKSFQEESSSFSLNDDVQQSPEEVILPRSNTLLISNDMIPNVDEASTSYNVFIKCLEDAYFDASTSFHDPSIEPANVAEALRDADWVNAMQDELDQFARLKVWRLVPRSEGKTIIKTKWIFKNKKDESSLVIQNKARLVAIGYSQQEGIGMMRRLHQLLKSKLYACSCKQYPDHVYALDKAVYGLKQALRAWYDVLSQFLIDSGFQKGDKLVCWSSKKQNCVSISIAESEYVAVFGYCAQVLWMRT